MYSRKQGIQPGPSINLCPKCHSHKEPNQSTCSVCNTRACPNGHILGATERICSRCNWVDRQMKPASTLYSTAKTGAKAEENLPQNICPVCHNRISSSASKCAYCGNLVRPDFDQIEPGSGLKSPPASGAPLHAESIIVQQETIGHHDKKRTYLCPNCRNRVDDPSSGKCPYCGYVGTMQYDITRKQPAWTAPPSPPSLPVPPPRQKVSAGEPPRYVPPEGVMAPPSQTQPPLYAPAEHAAVPPGQRESSCPSCGAPNPTDSRFCRTCGHRYGTGRTSKKILAESTAERSYRSATAPSEFFAPITASQAEAMEMGAEEMPARRRGKTVTAPQKGKALPREKKAGRSKQRPDR
ncbi:MAG TPA: zinc-ribbon domain-containing protein, partial [Dehalococcoidia bacterium]|nr:zinc-ribbon domain-containing protein [Dehalococcoidia bacterium]